MVDTALQIQLTFKKNMHGLPDSILGKNRNLIDLNPILNWLGMNRQQRRVALADGSLLHLHTMHQNRVKSFLTGMCKEAFAARRDVGIKAMLEQKSIECRAFGLYMPNWLLAQVDDQPVAPPLTDKLRAEEYLMAFYDPDASLPVINQFRAREGSPPIVRERMDENLARVRESVYRVAKHLENDLQLHVADASREQLVRWSEVAFAVWSLIGQRGIDILLAFPQLQFNFETIRAIAEELESSQKKANEPSTLEDFYIILSAMIEDALAAPKDKRLASHIQRYVNEHLTRLIAAPSVTAKEVQVKLDQFRETVSAILQRHLLVDHLHHDRGSLYQHIWVKELSSVLQRGTNTEELEQLILGLQSRVAAARLQYDQLDIRQLELQSARDSAQIAFDSATTYTAKREAKERLRAAKADLTELDEERFDAEGALLEAALPESVDLESFDNMLLPKEQDSLPRDQIDATSLDALDAVNWLALIHMPATHGDLGGNEAETSSDELPELDETTIVQVAEPASEVTASDGGNSVSLEAMVPHQDLAVAPEQTPAQFIASPVSPAVIPAHSEMPAVRQEPLAFTHGTMIDDCAIVAEAGAKLACDYEPVPLALLNSSVSHWLAKGELPRAILTLRLCAEQELGAGDDAPEVGEDLLNLAYIGLNVGPRPDSIFNDARVRLNVIDSNFIDTQMQYKHLRPVTAGLLFAGAFQAALFAGHETNAMRVLIDCRDYLDASLQNVITTMEQMAQRDIRLDFERLGRLADAKSSEEKIRELHSRLDAVQDRTLHKTTGWALARKALTDTLQQEEFRLAIDAVKKDDISQSDCVRHIITKYQREEAIREMMITQLRAFDVASLNAVAGQTTARNFINTVDELRSIFQAWLRLREVGNDRAEESQRMSERFVTQAKKAVATIQSDSDRTVDIARRAGNRLILMALGQVLNLIQKPVLRDPALTRTLLKLPAELLRCRWPDATTGQLLAHHFEDLVSLPAVTEQIECLLVAGNSAAAQALLDFSENQSMVAPFTARIAGLHGQLLVKLTERIGVAKVILNTAQQADVFVDSDETALYEFQLDEIDEFASEAGRYDPIKPLIDKVDRLIGDIQNRLSRQMESKKAELDDLTHQAQSQGGENAIPSDWQARAQSAIDSFQLPIVDEMIAQLREAINRHAPLLPLAVGQNEEADQFLAAEEGLFHALAQNNNSREVWARFTKSVTIPEKGYRPHLREVLEILAGWHHDRRMPITAGWSKALEEILTFIGFSIDESKQTSIEEDGAFRVVNVQVKRTETARGLPFFDGKYARGENCNVRVFVAVGNWNIGDLTACIERTALLHADVLISPAPLSHSKRVELASAMKTLDQAIFHIDPIMAAFIGLRNPADSRVLSTWLSIAATWTGYHPYNRGAIAVPAHPEMRYGLSQPANRLTKDLAILYGGRQLGKTTILHEGIRQAKLNGIVAGYEAFSRDLAKGDNPDDVYERCRNWVYSAVWKLLYQARLVTDPAGPFSSDDKQREIGAALDSPRIDKTILLCIDEVDPLLEIDALRGFGLFRALVSLHHKPGSRFKLVIAGLQNVRRFAHVPNLPLNQLGSTLPVTILSSQDAFYLVQEPLAYAGYYFANEMVVQEVLVETNRHPALIQAFCAHLLTYLHRRYAHKGLSEPITSADIRNVAAQPELKRHIRDRFELTLNIDRRYGLMIWGLIAEGVLTGTSLVTAGRVLEVVKRWAPDWFANTSEGNIDAYLTEMCGLGVLKSVGERKYALRNPSIVRLIGDSKQAEERLLDLLKSKAEDDALLTRRAKEKDNEASPFTLRDEQVLLANTAQREGNSRPRMDMYLVTGSVALGLDVDCIRTGIDLLNALKTGSARAHVDVRVDAQLRNVAEFKTWVSECLPRRSENSSYLLVKVSGEQGLDHLLALIDAAVEAETQVKRVNHPVKILFLLSPAAVWECHRRASLLAQITERVQRIGLHRWTSNAMEEQLERIGMTHTAPAVSEAMQVTDGWHFAVRKLLDMRRSNKLTAAKANELLRATGLDDAAMPWAVPTLRKLQDKDVLEGDEIGLALIETDEDLFADDSTCQAAIDWFVSMGILLPQAQHGPRQTSRYQVVRSVKAALAILK